LELGGKDATDGFEEIGHSPDATALLQKFYVGEVDGALQKPVEKKVHVNYPSGDAKDQKYTLLTSTNYFLLAAIPVVIIIGYAYLKFYS
jgi:cytochrome b5